MRKLLFLIILSMLPIFTAAQTASGIDFLTSWKATSYVEPTYEGRVLPTYGTPVQVGFEMLENGKRVDLKDYVINWVLDSAPLASERGLQTTSFTADPLKTGGAHQLKIVVTDYKGADRTKIINIPVKRPEIVIKNPFMRGKAQPGTYELKALLFYWNTTNPNDLVYSWQSNGEGESIGAGQNISLTIAPQATNYALRLSLNVRSRVNDLETASAYLGLVVR